MPNSSTTKISDGNAWSKGAYTAFLSPWNAGSLVQGKDYLSTFSFNQDLFPNSATLTWTWPDRPSSSVWNFNAIDFGNYLYTSPQTPIVPLQLKDIATLKQTYGVALGGDASKFDVVTDLFLTARPNDFSTKLFEIEVFLHTPAYTQGYVLSVTPLGTYTDAQGRAWTATINRAAGLAPDILFMPKGGGDLLSGTIDIKAMTDWLIAQKVMTGSEYFNGLAMGAETMQGSGSLTINSFGIDYAAKAGVINLNAPVIDSNGGGANASVSVAAGTRAVATVHATDADGTAPLYYLKGGADAALFTIDKTTGVLAFKDAPSYGTPKDAGGDNVYDVVVQAIDGVHADVQAIAVTVTAPTAAAPVIDSNGGGAGAALTIASGTRAVTTVHATDADGTAPTYAIAGGADAKLFTIDAATGVLAFKDAPSYGAPKDVGGDNVYNVTVEASDGVLTDAQDLTVSVASLDQSALAKALAAGSAPSTTTYAFTNERYDAKWAVTRSAETDVLRYDGTGLVTEQHGPGSALIASTSATLAGNAETVRHLDAKGVLTGTDVFVFDTTVTASHYDAAARLTARDVFSVQGGKAVEQHFDASGALTGTDVATAMSALKDRVDHLDAVGNATGFDLVYTSGGKFTAQHYAANGSFLGAEAQALDAAQALNHDPLKAWLIG